MFKRLMLAVGVLALFAGLAFGQQQQSAAPVGAPPGSQMLQPAPGPAIGAGQVGTPTYIVPPASAAPPESSVIDIGQALGPFLQPYINAIIGALLSALVGWLGVQANRWFGVKLDEGARNALTTALQNQAGSLIADGLVKLEGTKITVDNKSLAESANEIMAVIPDAATRLGFTPDFVAKRIMDTLPQTAAGAALVASATPVPMVATSAIAADSTKA
jgi:hypothetical protein